MCLINKGVVVSNNKKQKDEQLRRYEIETVVATATTIDCRWLSLCEWSEHGDARVFILEAEICHSNWLVITEKKMPTKVRPVCCQLGKDCDVLIYEDFYRRFRKTEYLLSMELLHLVKQTLMVALLDHVHIYTLRWVEWLFPSRGVPIEIYGSQATCMLFVRFMTFNPSPW